MIVGADISTEACYWALTCISSRTRGSSGSATISELRQQRDSVLDFISSISTTVFVVGLLWRCLGKKFKQSLALFIH